MDNTARNPRLNGAALLGEPQPLPGNAEAEQALLGAILVNNAAYQRVAGFLRPEHFAYDGHGRTYEAIGRLIDLGQPATAVILKQDSSLAPIGEAGYLARLVAAAVTVVNAEHYGRTIIDLWQRRELIAIADGITDRARREITGDTAAALIADAEISIAAVAGSKGAEASPLTSAADAALRSIHRAEAAYRGDDRGGIMSGIAALDRLTGGFQAGDLIYIGKRPSMGGTALAITLALNAARDGKRIGFWSAEMNAERIGRRMLAWMTGISTRAQRAGLLSQAEWAALIAAQHAMRAYPLTIDDTAPLGVGTLRRRAQQMQRGGLDLILVDYLQLLRTGDGREDLPLRDAVPKVSGALRDLAKELSVPVVCLAQLTPDIDKRENKRPMISDIRWTHDAEQDAAVMAMLYREEYYLANAEPQRGVGGDDLKADKLHAQWSQALADSRGRAELIVVKARDDETGTARVAFDGVRSLFSDLDDTQGRML